MIEEYHNQQLPEEEKHEEFKQLSTMSPVSAAFIALIGIFLLYQFGGALLTLIIFGFNFEKADVNAVRLLTMGGQILLMLLPTLVLARYVYRDNVSIILRMRFPSFKEIGAFILGLILLTPLLQNLIYIQNFLLQKLAAFSPFVKSIMNSLDQWDALVEKTYGNLLSSHSVFETSFIIFVVAVIPAICEETLFRGFVQKSFEQRLKPLWSILITGIFFGLYHFNPYGLVALIALGLYFGYAAYASNSIFVPIALHFFNNFIAVLAFLILGKDELINTSATQNDNVLPQLISLIIFSILFFAYITYVKMNYHKLLPKHPEEL